MNEPATTRADEGGCAAERAYKRVGIMGGTFDPVHTGHLICAEQAAYALQLDEVLFMPTAIPSFKRDANVTPAEDRLAMCRLAVAGNPLFSADSTEVDRGGISYTADTLRTLAERMPDAQLFFITGTDAAASLPRWREADEIVRLAHVVAVARPGYKLPDELIAWGVQSVECNALDVSSSQIREHVAKGESIRYLVPDAVASYIAEHGLYAAEDGCYPADSGDHADAPTAGDCGEASDELAPDLSIPDAFSPEFFKAREAELTTRVKPKRFRHIMGVSETAAHLAQVYGVDEKKARLAGLLHDWDKAYDDPGIRARVAQLGMHVDPLVLDEMPQTLHGMTAAVALGRRYPQIPADVLQAVYRHTVATPDMSPLDMVVYIADALEPNRQFGRIDELRAEIGVVSLEELFIDVFGYWTSLITERHATLHPSTIDVWNAYAIRRKAGREYRDDGKDRVAGA